MGHPGPRIRALRVHSGWSQEDLVNRLPSSCRIKRSELSLLENEKRELNTSLLEALADIFECSTDFLLGRSDRLR